VSSDVATAACPVERWGGSPATAYAIQSQWQPLGGLNAQVIADVSSRFEFGVAATDDVESHARTQEKLSGSSMFSSCTETSKRPESASGIGVRAEVAAP
jgi:hypothetical protein